MLKLVIADDETLILENIAQSVDWKKYNIEITGLYTSGKEVMEHILNEHVDIIISDIKIPFYTGIDIAKYCYDHSLGTRIILISAYRDFDFAQQALNYNVLAYITKPYTTADIEEKIAFIANENNHDINSATTFLTQSEYQSIFSDIFCGNVNHSEIPHLVKYLNLRNQRGKIIKATIPNYNNYTDKYGKYGSNRLFNLMMNLSFQKSDNTCFTLVSAERNIFTIIAICDNTKTISEYITSLSGVLKSLDGLVLDSEIIKSFNELDELIGYSLNTANSDRDFLSMVNDYISANYSGDIKLDDITNALCMSKTYFCALYKKYTNETFVETLQKFRMKKASELLLNSDIKTSQIYEMVGYKSKPYFYKLFKEAFGMSPLEYRQIYGK